mmetsp:Transcript_10593/g.26471  ORF Transcript_10593/g.26471 Transcript_10593/m.26471 type:complete len:84 (-) Transcript_10593:1485-1736(-)
MPAPGNSYHGLVRSASVLGSCSYLPHAQHVACRTCVRAALMIIAFSEILFVLTFRLPPTEYELIFVSLLLTAGCCLLLQRGGG